MDMHQKYDYLLVGAGLFNAVFADLATRKGYRCLVIDKRKELGGNCYTYVKDDIVVHKYGAHIFRTSDKDVWDYFTQYADFNHFINSPIANFNGELYNLPFNMNTFSKLWKIRTPEEAKRIIKEQSKCIKGEPLNLEEHAIKLAGKDIYEKLIKGYTEKQWGKQCRELPPSIMRRIPLRFTYDNNYFNDRFQGIPIGGYTRIFEKMFQRADVYLEADFLEDREYYSQLAKTIIYTGEIDRYFDYCYGHLEYRSLKFEIETLPMENYQGVAVMNFTDSKTPYTRVIEHKHFEFGTQKNTVISYEYPEKWEDSKEPYYPMEDVGNRKKYERYKDLSLSADNIYFGGRLGEYRYYDMQDTIKSAMKLVNCLCDQDRESKSWYG